jgi:hypothetical protein
VLSLTAKDIVDILTAAGALVAAIASLVSAVKSSKAKTEAEQAKTIASQIKTEVTTNILTSLNTVVRQTQALQQNQNQNIHITVAGTSAQALSTTVPILEQRELALDRVEPPGQREQE